MKTKTRKILAVIVIIVIAAGWFISISGVGPVKKLSKQLKYGLDINGGVYVLLEANTKANGNELTKLMEQTKTVLENRVNAMGISEATVSVEGSKRVRVEMPGVQDATQAIKQIGRTAQLKFLLADGTPVMTGTGVKDASFSTDSDHGGYKITMDFTSKGQEAFSAATEKASSGTVTPLLKDEQGNSVQKNAIVIMLDDAIISAPGVDQKISSSSCEIFRQGGFSQEEAKQTSGLIRGGALPASLSEVNSSVETATVGADALNLSVKAGFIGLIIVFVLMLLAYGALGFVADIALMLYVLLDLWIMAAFGVVLSLPGIAAIILSIGMAVDSNVIIFTRIREEIEKGKSIRVAVDSGFHSALATVIDAQTTTLIAAIVLYLIGTTSVKGFAITLMIGTVISIFTAVFITQLFVTLMAESKAFGTGRFFGIKENGQARFAWRKHIHFVANRKKYYMISAAVIVIGIIFAMVRGFNYGIDFTGGTTLQINMGKQVSIEDIKDTIKDHKLNPTIVYAGKGNEQIIIKTIKALNAEKRSEVVKTLDQKYDIGGKKAVLASEEFGPTVGKTLRRNAVKSILIAMFFMLIYIRFRFKNWRYGLSAIAGLVHDVFMTLALYAIFGFTINNPFIAGILTVVGYSINDTIVVFDRIRENARYYKRKELDALVDNSVNETLSRSIMTSITTLVVMIPLFFMATDEMRQFLIPLIIGVTCGTYSSIFLCSPLYYEFNKKDVMSRYEDKLAKKEKERKKRGRGRDAEGIVK